jgi:hypothetical protein
MIGNLDFADFESAGLVNGFIQAVLSMPSTVVNAEDLKNMLNAVSSSASVAGLAATQKLNLFQNILKSIEMLKGRNIAVSAEAISNMVDLVTGMALPTGSAERVRVLSQTIAMMESLQNISVLSAGQQIALQMSLSAKFEQGLTTLNSGADLIQMIQQARQAKDLLGAGFVISQTSFDAAVSKVLSNLSSATQLGDLNSIFASISAAHAAGLIIRLGAESVLLLNTRLNEILSGTTLEASSLTDLKQILGAAKNLGLALNMSGVEASLNNLLSQIPATASADAVSGLMQNIAAIVDIANVNPGSMSLTALDSALANIKSALIQTTTDFAHYKTLINSLASLTTSLVGANVDVSGLTEAVTGLNGLINKVSQAGVSEIATYEDMSALAVLFGLLPGLTGSSMTQGQINTLLSGVPEGVRNAVQSMIDVFRTSSNFANTATFLQIM